jgi:hypothetical protein
VHGSQTKEKQKKNLIEACGAAKKPDADFGTVAHLHVPHEADLCWNYVIALEIDSTIGNRPGTFSRRGLADTC